MVNSSAKVWHLLNPEDSNDCDAMLASLGRWGPDLVCSHAFSKTYTIIFVDCRFMLLEHVFAASEGNLWHQ